MKTVQIVQEVIEGIPEVPEIFLEEKDAYEYYYECAIENDLETDIDDLYSKENMENLIEEVGDQFENGYNLYWWETNI